MEIKQTNFTVSTTHMWFDANGDPSIGFDILQWDLTGTERRIKTIGEYSPSGTIKLPEDLVQKMRNVTVKPSFIIHDACCQTNSELLTVLIASLKVTAYNCSKTCEPGHELKRQRRRCCKQCVPCAEVEISPGDGEI